MNDLLIEWMNEAYSYNHTLTQLLSHVSYLFISIIYPIISLTKYFTHTHTHFSQSFYQNQYAKPSKTE